VPGRGIIKEIRRKIQRQEYEYSLHAGRSECSAATSRGGVKRKLLRAGAVIEDYPSDKYGPSCLVLGLHESWETATHSVHSSGPTRIKIHYGL